MDRDNIVLAVQQLSVEAKFLKKHCVSVMVLDCGAQKERVTFWKSETAVKSAVWLPKYRIECRGLHDKDVNKE